MSTLKEICKEQTEMIDEMRQNIKELTEENEKLSEQYSKMLEERNSLIDDLSWYKAKVSRLEQLIQDEVDDKIKGLEDEKERLKEIKQEKEQLEESFHYQLEKGLEYFNKYQELKEKNGELQEVIEGKNSDLLFTEDENKQLKESRDWDYEYIIKVNEENKRLKREKEEFHRKLMTQLEVNTTLRMSNKYKLKLLSEFSQHIGNKPTSSTYKYFRAKLDALEIREEPTSMSVADMQPMTELQLTKDSSVQGVPLTNEAYEKAIEEGE